MVPGEKISSGWTKLTYKLSAQNLKTLYLPKPCFIHFCTQKWMKVAGRAKSKETVLIESHSFQLLLAALRPIGPQPWLAKFCRNKQKPSLRRRKKHYKTILSPFALPSTARIGPANISLAQLFSIIFEYKNHWGWVYCNFLSLQTVNLITLL